MRRFLISIVLAAMGALTLTAGLKEDFKADKWMSANNYWAYPYPARPLPVLTEAPEGYAPFFIDHYGRHGSRWLIGKRFYSYTVEQLERGQRHGALTPRGLEVLDILRMYLFDRKGLLEDEHRDRVIEAYTALEIWPGQETEG